MHTTQSPEPAKVSTILPIVRCDSSSWIALLLTPSAPAHQPAVHHRYSRWQPARAVLPANITASPL
jgi:hypothetical protein